MDFREAHENRRNPWSDRESVFSLRDSKPKIIDVGQGNKDRWKTGLKGKKERRERKHESRDGLSKQGWKV